MPADTRAQSARTLLWLSGTLIVIGLAVLSPAAMFLSMGVAALSALGAVPLGSGRLRIVALAMLALAAGLTVYAYPGFLADQQRYREASRAEPPAKP